VTQTIGILGIGLAPRTRSPGFRADRPGRSAWMMTRRPPPVRSARSAAAGPVPARGRRRPSQHARKNEALPSQPANGAVPDNTIRIFRLKFAPRCHVYGLSLGKTTFSGTRAMRAFELSY
jgi:hypothetical protein